jgi:hypothetical protein
MLISVHIPKTAGTAFRSLLQQHFGERLYFDYTDRPLAPHFAWRRLASRWKRGVTTDVSAYECIHGHFIADKYDFLGSAARHVAWLRDPVQRVASHYYYWRRVPDMRNVDCRRLIEQRLSLDEFAAMPRMRNVASRFFAGKSPRSFFFIGLVEDAASSIARFHRLTGIGAGGMQSENLGDPSDVLALDLSPALRGRIEVLNRADRALYDEAAGLLAR